MLRIQQLSKDVINKISAGEVVQRPANAIKELLENSIDAGAKNIVISIQDGGLEEIKIVDDGSGIHPDDMKILAKRHTTSKIKTAEDLQEVETFGFRGEAIASLSYVSKLSVLSKMEKAPGFLCHYAKEEIQSVKMQAAKIGTTVTARNLFYNLGTRRKSMKPLEELKISVEYTKAYALQYASERVSISLHKTSSSSLQPSLVFRNVVNSTQNDLVEKSVANLYSKQIAKELIKMPVEKYSQELAKLGCKVKHFYGTRASYILTLSKFQILIFVNNRFVESKTLHKSLQLEYQKHLPKNVAGFVYLSIFIEPKNLDVNFHPTKKQVQFLNEDEIAEELVKILSNGLASSSESRSMSTSLVNTHNGKAITPPRKRQRVDDSFVAPKGSKEVYQHEKIRTDPNQRKMTEFLKVGDWLFVTASFFKLNTLNSDVMPDKI